MIIFKNCLSNILFIKKILAVDKRVKLQVRYARQKYRCQIPKTRAINFVCEYICKYFEKSFIYTFLVIAIVSRT